MITMLGIKTKEFVENARDVKKKIHMTIMSDSLETMDGTTFDMLKSTMDIIDQALDLCKEQAMALEEIDRKLTTLLDKIEG